MTDAELLALSIAEPAQFAVVFERHAEAIYAYLQRRIGTSAAEELASETFLTAYRRRTSYDTAFPDARPWLFGIATNLLRRQWRRERRELHAYAKTGVDPVIDEIDDAARRADATLAGPALARALVRLRPVERDVLLLSAWADLSYAEIAAALQLPVGTVRSRLHRARRHMRELLAPNGQSLVDQLSAEANACG